MSSNRRTAFARVPRGTAQSTAGNDPGRFTRIDKRFLDSLTDARIAPEVSTVLTRTDSKIHVEIGANGKGEYKIVQKSGITIGDDVDLQKVQSLGTFINEERKSVLKSTVSSKTKKFLAALVQLEEASKEAGGKRLVFTKAFVDVFRGIQSQMETLNHNVNQLVALEVEGANKMVVDHLIETAMRSRIAAVRFLIHRAELTEGQEPLKLNDFLMTEGAMTWCFTRLSAQKMQMNVKGFEPRHIYFPRDVTKGLTLTYREVKDASLVDCQGEILAGLAPYRGMFEDTFVRLFCGIPEEWDLQSFGPKDPAKLMGQVPVLVPAPASAVSNEESLTALGKNADRGINWQAGNGFQPHEVLKFIGTIPKRASLGCVAQPHTKAALLSRVFPGFSFVSTDMNSRGVYTQIAIWGKIAGSDISWFQNNGAENAHAIRIPLLRDILGIPLVGIHSTTLTLSVLESVTQYGTGVPTPQEEDLWGKLTHQASVMSDKAVEDLLSGGRLEGSLDPKTKGAKDDAFRNARSALGTPAKELIHQLKAKKYHALADRVGAWLRTFFSVTLQDAVAASISARLEAYLSTPISFGSEDLVAHFDAINLDWAQAQDEPDAMDEDGNEDRRENPDE